MNNINILPADTFIVINKTILNDEDRKILTMLYQPIIGSGAIGLYFTLWSYLDRSELIAENISHHELSVNIGDTISNIINDRKKLEAIGLLKTYYKSSSINNYVYQLYSPVSVNEFFNNSILGPLLLNSIGEKAYTRIVNYFKIPCVSLNDFQDITSSFCDVFEFVSISPLENTVDNLKIKNSNNLKLKCDVNVSELLDLIPDDFINKKGITKETKNLLVNIANLYGFNNDELVEIIKNSIDEKKNINKTRFKNNAKSYYQFENNGEVPTIIFRSQPDYLRNANDNYSKKNKLINVFETTSPYHFLKSKYNGGNPSKTDISLIEYLAVDLKLNPGVINVLIDYVLKINNNKLTRSFVEVIAGQWKRKNIETVSSAMTEATNEYKTRKTKNSNNTKEIIKPNWFDKNVDVSLATNEEMEEIDNMLNNL